MAASDGVRLGVRYAFGRGLDPRLKDGVRAHPAVFAAGVLFHAGIGAAGLTALAALFDSAPVGAWRLALAASISTGLASGVFLLARRLRDPVLQTISIVDDYISNLLVVGVLAAAAVPLFDPGHTVLLLLSWAVLAAYAPFGKIRHCVLFFVTRARFGAFIGTRGIIVRRPRP